MESLARKLVESALAAAASIFICSILFAAIFWGVGPWWQANCIHVGPGTFACHAAAFYMAWWWLAAMVTIPIIAVLLLAVPGRHRR